MTKFYNNIISLGLNCELGRQLYLRFGDPIYTLLHWTAVLKPEKLPEIIHDPNIIFSGEVSEIRCTNMWQCKCTDLVFHGNRKPADLLMENGEINLTEVEREKCDTISRVKHIAQKFANMSKNQETKLFVLALHPQYYIYKSNNPNSFIRHMYMAIKKSTINSQLLVITENKYFSNFNNLEGLTDLYIRAISQFGAPDKAADITLQDTAGYDKIFSEFRQLKILNKEKVYKFQT